MRAPRLSSATISRWMNVWLIAGYVFVKYAIFILRRVLGMLSSSAGRYRTGCEKSIEFRFFAAYSLSSVLREYAGNGGWRVAMVNIVISRRFGGAKHFATRDEWHDQRRNVQP